MQTPPADGDEVTPVPQGPGDRDGGHQEDRYSKQTETGTLVTDLPQQLASPAYRAYFLCAGYTEPQAVWPQTVYKATPDLNP